MTFLSTQSELLCSTQPSMDAADYYYSDDNNNNNNDDSNTTSEVDHESVLYSAHIPVWLADLEEDVDEFDLTEEEIEEKIEEEIEEEEEEMEEEEEEEEETMEEEATMAVDYVDDYETLSNDGDIDEDEEKESESAIPTFRYNDIHGSLSPPLSPQVFNSIRSDPLASSPSSPSSSSPTYCNINSTQAPRVSSSFATCSFTSYAASSTEPGILSDLNVNDDILYQINPYAPFDDNEPPYSPSDDWLLGCYKSTGQHHCT